MTVKLTNENYCGEVVQLTSLTKLEGLDNLVGVLIKNQQVLVSKDTQEGDIGVFFPAGCKLDSEFLSNNNLFRHTNLNIDQTKAGYFEDSGRVRSVKFKGVISEGIWVPLEYFDYILGFIEEPVNFEVGTRFNEINGKVICTRYIRESTGRLGTVNGKQKKSHIPDEFEFHPDTSKLVDNLHKFNLGDVIHVTEKLHGTSWVAGQIAKENSFLQRCWNWIRGKGFNKISTELVWSSRRVYKAGGIWEDIANKLKPIFERDFPNQTVLFYGEAVGYFNGGAIQSGYSYGCEPNEYKLYVYRVNHQGEEKTLDDLIEYCGKPLERPFEPVPLLEVVLIDGEVESTTCLHGNIQISTFPSIDSTLEYLKQTYLEMDCPYNKGMPREGVCVRVGNQRVGNQKAYKLKSARFLNWEDKASDKKDNVDMEEEQNVSTS